MIHVFFVDIKVQIYLLDENLLPPLRGQRALKPRKETRKNEQESEKSEGKRDRGTTEGETSDPNPAIDALIGDEEQTGKKRTRRKRGGAGL